MKQFYGMPVWPRWQSRENQQQGRLVLQQAVSSVGTAPRSEALRSTEEWLAQRMNLALLKS